jgi:hypothetical protein
MRRFVGAQGGRDQRRGKTPTMFEQTFKNIDDVLWKEAGCIPESQN